MVIKNKNENKKSFLANNYHNASGPKTNSNFVIKYKNTDASFIRNANVTLGSVQKV